MPLTLRWLVETGLIVLGYPNITKEMNHMNSSNNNNKSKGMGSEFRMPLHYPRYSKEEYEKMEEWRLDLLLNQYGLCVDGDLQEKRAYAIGTFLWPDQY